ncbi:MAG TPA: helix-turn-helix transcriptional regulator [Smithellaceae bacterium]|jgi:transcriptional regulator with XRE-family HTH domain|nr:helix-turn-helix transcriptional regulator [Smithellaceae bacterium]
MIKTQLWGLSYFKTSYNLHMGKQIENERLLLGRRIRSLRNIKGWTQEELGSHADLSYKFIGEIERGQQNSSFDTLVKIATALKVDILELFRFEQETIDKTVVENRIGRIVKGLPDEDVRRLLMVLRVLYPVV